MKRRQERTTTDLSGSAAVRREFWRIPLLTIATSRRSAQTCDGSMIPNDPDALLTRKATAEALTESGLPVAAGTLSTKAVRGGGPPYRRFGTRVLYRWADAFAWAQSRLSPPIITTSEADAKPASSERPVLSPATAPPRCPRPGKAAVAR
jgi:hypothetical protein